MTQFTDLMAAQEECDWLAIMSATPHAIVEDGNAMRVWPADEILKEQKIIYRYPEAKR